MGDGGSKRAQILDAASKDERRRRRERVIIALMGVLVGALLYLVDRFFHLAQSNAFTQDPLIYFFNFAVWALLLVLILVLVFLIVRNVVKFLFERRRGVMGARLRMRLIMAFMTLTIGPAAVLFFLSTFILNTSIERLYEPHVMNVAVQSKDVLVKAANIGEAARTLLAAKYEADGEDALHFAEEISRSIIERGWIDVVARDGSSAGADEGPENDSSLGGPGSALDGGTQEAASVPTATEQLGLFIKYKRMEYNLDSVSVYNKSGGLLARAVKENWEAPPVPLEDVKKALSGAVGINPPIEVAGGAVIYSFYPVPRRAGSEESEMVGVVVCGRLVSWAPEKDLAKLEGARAAAEEASEDYETLRRLELPIKGSYFILLMFVTLIVIFLAIWFGFYVSKGITEPIILLAEGTEMVASGNLDYKIDLSSSGDDEISALVRSFNKMTGDLAKSRSELNSAYRSLSDTNLELEQRRKYTETVLAHVAAGVISTDPDARISTINPAGLAMIGKESPAEVRGKDLAEVLQSDVMDVIKSLAGELEKDDKSMAQRQISTFRGGHSAVLLITVSPLRDAQGQSLGSVIVIDDMSELVRAHRAMAWREVARRIAHEIKNPLTPIQLAAQRLERRYAGELTGEDAEVFSQCTRTIIRQVEELKHLVNEFSLFARLPSIKPEPSDLHDILREVLPLYREAHHRVRFELVSDDRLPLIELDREQIKRVFINLLDNAVSSIKDEGEVEVETMYNDQLNIVRIEIRDSGHGIPQYVKDRLFEPYYSTKPQGSGLGLTIVQRIISDHYGYIRVADNEPRGTTFIIELPVILTERKIDPGKKAKSM